MFSNEEEAGDLGPTGVEASVGLDVELVRADDLTVVRAIFVVAAIGVDFVVDESGGVVVGVHGGFGMNPSGGSGVLEVFCGGERSECVLCSV